MKKGFELIYRKDNSNQFWKLFNLLVAKYRVFGSIYDPITLDWYYIKAKEYGFNVIDYSCIFTFDGVPFSAFIGAKMFKEGLSRLTLFEAPCLAIDAITLSTNKKKQIYLFGEKILTQNIEQYQIKGPDINSSLPVLCEYFLSKNKFKLKPITTRVIDLSQSEIDLKRDIRKRYKSFINWGMSNLKIEVHDKSNIQWEIIEIFRELHIKAAQRETRSIETWRKQFDAITNGLAFCITGYLNEELATAAYFLCPHNICNYGVSASNRALFDKPMSHALIWKAILESKKRGKYFFDIGQTYFANSEISKTKKEKDIANFKKGFGGKLVINYLIEN